MGDQIWRYTVDINDKVQRFALPGDPLAVSCRRFGELDFWARAGVGEPVQDRHFVVVGTGNQLPAHLKTPRWHWGIGIGPEGGAWHLVEVWPNPT